MSLNTAIFAFKAIQAISAVKQAKSQRRQLELQAQMQEVQSDRKAIQYEHCLLYTSPSPRDVEESRMPSSA